MFKGATMVTFHNSKCTRHGNWQSSRRRALSARHQRAWQSQYKPAIVVYWSEQDLKKAKLCRNTDFSRCSYLKT